MSEDGTTVGIGGAVGGDAADLLAFLRWGSRNMPNTTARGMRRAAALLERRLREALSGGVLKRDTSTLVRTVGTSEADSGLQQRIGASTFYLATHEGIVENAEVSGNFVVIRPRVAKALRFQVPRRGGPWVTTKAVRIPIRRPVGTTYDEHGEEALEEAWATIERALDGGVA